MEGGPPRGGPWPVEYRPLAAIKPYAANPRRNDAAVGAVAASIREFALRQPIVIDATGAIVAGHMRWKAGLADWA